MLSNESDGGASISIGFVLNMGIAVVFIALIFLVLQGALDRNTVSTEAQLEEVGHEVNAMLISADKLALTEGAGTAYFEPPESGLDSYTVDIDGGTSGNITVSSGRDSIQIKFSTVSTVSSTQFSGSTTRVAVKYDGVNPPRTISFPG